MRAVRGSGDDAQPGRRYLQLEPLRDWFSLALSAPMPLAAAMMAFAWAQLVFSAAARAAVGAARFALSTHFAFLAASVQERARAAAALTLPPDAAAMQASHASPPGFADSAGVAVDFAVGAVVALAVGDASGAGVALAVAVLVAVSIAVAVGSGANVAAGPVELVSITSVPVS